MTASLATHLTRATAAPLALVPVAPTLRFGIPPEDAPEFYSSDYSDTVRQEVSAWLRILQRVHGAARSRTATMRAEARIAGKTYGAVSAMYYKFRDHDGDWRVLVDRRCKGSGKPPSAASGLPDEFRDHVRRIAGNNKRSFAAAYVQLIKQWRMWRRHGRPEDAIPGYRTAPEPDEKGRHPHGWSQRTMYRLLPKKAELVIARIGTAAATEFLPCIPGTRRGLRWLEYVPFDDVWRNRKLCVAGLLDPCRLLQLGCLDLATGYYLKFGLRPELPASDERKRERLKKADMLMLVAAFLAEYGYPLDYRMHLILERGTATLYAAEAKALYDYTGGQVVCCYTSMQGQLVAAWEESRTGNPRGKGALESWHNLLHNWEAADAGNMGSDRDRTPAVLAAQEREARQLNQIALAMTPEQRARLRFPFPSVEEAHARTLEIVDEINRREDHACEGFDRVTWWRLKGTKEWQPEGELAHVPAAVRDYLEYDPRVETPHQRMLRLSQGVRVGRVPGSLLKSFLADSRVVRPITRAAFAFESEGKKYAYLPDSPAEALPEGTVLTGHFSPLDMSVVHLTDEAGCFVGTWKRLKAAPRGSAEQAEQFGITKAYMAHAVRNVQRTHAPDIAAERARMDGNLAVAAEAGLIPVPASRSLAQVAAHCNGNADALQRAISGQENARQDRVAAARQPRASAIPGDLSDLLNGGLSVRPATDFAADVSAATTAPETARAEDVTPGPLW